MLKAPNSEEDNEMPQDMGFDMPPMGDEQGMGSEPPMGNEPPSDDMSADLGEPDMGNEPEDEATRHIMNMLQALPEPDKRAAERYIESLGADNGNDESDGGEEPMGNMPPQEVAMQESCVREFNNVAMNKRDIHRDYKKVGDDIPLTNNPFVSNRR